MWSGDPVPVPASEIPNGCGLVGEVGVHALTGRGVRGRLPSASADASRSPGYHRPVPMYEFRCGACGERFEALVVAGTDAVECRSCGEGGAERVLSAPSAPFGLVKTPSEARRQERRNADLRARTKADFKAQRKAVRDRKEQYVSLLPVHASTKHTCLLHQSID